MTAYGYIRKSVVHDATRMISPDMQEAEIRRLAEFDHHDDVVILSDLDISGTKDRTQRPGWDEVLTAIESGECKDLYAYSMSRLARSVDQLSAVRKLCTKHGVELHLVKEKVDTSSASGRLYWNLQSSFEEFWADVTSERVKDAFATKRAKDPGWRGPGNRPYGEGEGEDVTAVVDAFREAGSFDGAARLLNERGVPSRYNGSLWFGSVVATIMRRVAGDEVLPAVRRGAPAGSHSFRLSQLLACGTCGTFLTPSKDARWEATRYYCHRARVVPHVRGWVTERVVLPGVAAEVGRAALMMKRMQKGSRDDEAQLAALAAKRIRIGENYDDGVYDKAKRDTRRAAVVEAESKLSTRRMVRRITIPPLIMDATDEDGAVVKGGEPAEVNAYLRRLLVRVVVDMSEPGKKGPSKSVPAMKFEWRDPSLRIEDVGDEDAS